MSSSASSISSVSSTSSSTTSVVQSPFLYTQQTPFARPLTTSDLHAIWEAVILDTQYAIRLDGYITRTNDYVLRELVNILRAVDLLTTPAAELQRTTHAAHSTLSIRYPQRTIRNAVMKLLETRNFNDVCNRMEEERAWNTPPGDFVVLPHVHAPIPTPDSPIYVDTFVPSPPPESSLSEDLKASIINTAIELSLQDQSEEFIPTSEIPENPLGAPLEEIILVPETPHPSIHPPMVLPEEPIPIPPPTPKRKGKGKKRSIDTKTILSFGLASSNALRPLHNRYPGEPDPQRIIEIAQLEASLTTQEHHENFVCRVCSRLGHKQKFCNRYFCRICRKFAPGHLTPHCKDLRGRCILC